MLDKFLNKKVRIITTTYGSAVSATNKELRKLRNYAQEYVVVGIVTNIDSNFIEVDNNLTIQIKYIISVENI